MLDLALPIAMIVVGSQHCDNCRYSEATNYLIVAGSVYLSFATLRYLVHCCIKDKEGSHKKDGLKNVVKAIEFIANFAILIWGSVTVLTYHKTWVHDDPESEFYCHYTPFMFAFVVIIVFWVLMVPALLFICAVTSCFSCICCAFCCASCCGNEKIKELKGMSDEECKMEANKFGKQMVEKITSEIEKKYHVKINLEKKNSIGSTDQIDAEVQNQKNSEKIQEIKDPEKAALPALE